MTQIILWEDARHLFEQIAEEVIAAIRGGFRLIAGRSDHGYTTVYRICRQHPPNNHCEDCYSFIEEIAEKYANLRGREREIFINFHGYMFKYLNMFYVKRFELVELKPMMEKTMDLFSVDAKLVEKARLYHLKKVFLGWACDEELLGETHADSGPAKKRQCVMFEELAKEF